MGGVEVERKQKFMPEKIFALIEINSQTYSTNQNCLSLCFLIISKYL